MNRSNPAASRLDRDLQWCVVHVDGRRVNGRTNIDYAIASFDPFQRAIGASFALARIGDNVAKLGY